jgi:hypothetical protein
LYTSTDKTFQNLSFLEIIFGTLAAAIPKRYPVATNSLPCIPATAVRLRSVQPTGRHIFELKVAVAERISIVQHGTASARIEWAAMHKHFVAELG